LARPIEEQDERESQRLWQAVTKAIRVKDQNTATDEKSRIEDMQRVEASKRTDEGVDWRPRLFRPVQGGPGGVDEGQEDLDFVINAKMYVALVMYDPCVYLADSHSDGQTSEELTKQILSIAPILPGQKADSRFSIPERSSFKTSQDDSQTPQVTSEQEQKSATNGDLIDLQEEPVPRPVTVGAEHQSVPSIQGDPPGAVKPQETKDRTSLIDLSEGMQGLGVNENPPPKSSRFDGHTRTPSLKRMDSETQAVDEFHDAES
jgi:hypothetical protein